MKLTSDEKYYLKRLAALQFPGSKDNYSTRIPIHFLQEQTDKMEKVDIFDFDYYKEDIVAVEYDDYANVESYATVEELVCRHLDDFDPSDKEAVKKYNDMARKDGELEFVTYEKAVDSGEIPGSDEYIGDLHDYLNAYGIEPGKVTIYRSIDEWNVIATSFTHKGALEAEKKLSNHIFRPTRIYAHTTSSGDFPVLMGVLMKLANELLDSEWDEIAWSQTVEMSPEQIREQYKKTPNEEFCAASYYIELPDQMIGKSGNRNVILSVYAKGEVECWSGSEYSRAKLRVVLKDGDKEYNAKWPFNGDSECNALLNDSNMITLLNYVRYSVGNRRTKYEQIYKRR